METWFIRMPSTIYDNNSNNNNTVFGPSCTSGNIMANATEMVKNTFVSQNKADSM